LFKELVLTAAMHRYDI